MQTIGKVQTKNFNLYDKYIEINSSSSIKYDVNLVIITLSTCPIHVGFRPTLLWAFCITIKFLMSRFKKVIIKIKSSLYSRYYAEACNEWRGPSPRLSAWATQLRKNVVAVASRWRHCADLTGPDIEPQTYRTESVRLATELTAG